MSLARSVFVKWLAHSVVLAVGFYMMPLVMNVLGKPNYAAWLFIQSVVGYSTLLYMGFGPTVCRYVADHRSREEWDALNGVVSGISAVYCVAAAGVMLVAAGLAAAAPWMGDWGEAPLWEVRAVLLILGLNIAIGMVGSVYGGVLIACQRFDAMSWLEGSLALVRLGLTVALLQRRQGLLTLALIFLGVTIVENLITAVLAHREVATLSVGRRHITRASLRECFSFSLFTALRGMAVRVIHLTDVIVIGAILGKEAAVPYYVALRLVQMLHAPLEKIGDVVLPKAGDLNARGEHRALENLMARAMGMGLLLAGAFVLGSAFFGKLFVAAWMGPGLEQSWLILVLLATAQVVGQPMIVLRQTLMAIGDVRRTAYLDLAQAAANLVLSLVLIQFLGLVGVAWGTLIPLVVFELGLLLPYGVRRLKFSGRRLLAHAVLPQLPALAAVGLYCVLVSRLALQPGWLTIVAIAAGAGAVLGGCWIVQSGWLVRRAVLAKPPGRPA